MLPLIDGDGLFGIGSAAGADNAGQFVDITGNMAKGDAQTHQLLNALSPDILKHLIKSETFPVNTNITSREQHAQHCSSTPLFQDSAWSKRVAFPGVVGVEQESLSQSNL